MSTRRIKANSREHSHAAALHLAASILALVAVGSFAAEMPGAKDGVDVFVTGNEQSVIARFVADTDEPPSGFLNSLDQAMAVLLAKAHPAPNVMQLAGATVAALYAEAERHTPTQISEARRKDWVLTVSKTKSFGPVLADLAERGPATDQLVAAGLNGMLKASGWKAACVLSRSEAEELKKLAAGRGTPTAERGVIGLKLDRWPVVDVVPDASAAEAGLQKGDVVVAVNNQDVAGSRTAADAMKMLQGPPGDMVKITVNRAGRTLAFQVKRISAAAASVSAQRANTNVLLIRIPAFEGSGIADAVQRFIRSQATNQHSVVILDLRDNGGGRPEEANGVADIFLDEKLLQICEFHDGRRIAFKSKPGAVGGRVIVLSNRQTGSAAEMLAMALQAHSRAMLVGEPTAGALFGKDIVELAGGQTILFRTAPTVLAPNGRDYSGTGIPPDAQVRDSTSEGRDEILSRALELARGEESKE